MIRLERVGTLPLAAASGLVRVGADALAVVADDANEIVVIGWPDGRVRRRVALPGGALPADAKARKRVKPDYEALCVVPGLGVVAFGSGSTPARRRAAVMTLGDWNVRQMDLAGLYGRLGETWPELNVEGAAAVSGAVWLLQRGNGARGENGIAIVEARLEEVRRIIRVELGEREGVALGFTDACALADGRVVFVAAAEDSPDTYQDGRCVGSVVGLLDGEGRVIACEAVEGHDKLEGVSAELGEGGVIELILCADADDPSVMAPLFRARWRATVAP